MRVLSISILALFLTGCLSQNSNNYILFKKEGFEIFHSSPVSRVSVVDSRVRFEINSNDRERLIELGSVYDEPIVVEVFVGENFYTEALIDLRFNFGDSMSLPKEEQNLGVFQKAGISVRGGN